MRSISNRYPELSAAHSSGYGIRVSRSASKAGVVSIRRKAFEEVGYEEWAQARARGHWNLAMAAIRDIVQDTPVAVVSVRWLGVDRSPHDSWLTQPGALTAPAQAGQPENATPWGTDRIRQIIVG